MKTPYNPDSGTKNGGRRIMLGDSPEKIAETIKKGPLNAQIALTRLGLAALSLKRSLPGIIPEDSMQPEDCLNLSLSLIEKYEIAKLKRRFMKPKFF